MSPARKKNLVTIAFSVIIAVTVIAAVARASVILTDDSGVVYDYPIPARTVSGEPAARPNFLVVMVDDQANNSFRRDVQPETFSRLIDQGTAFKNSYATPPLCCPARAAFQTGQYPHNNGVLSNDYSLLKDPENTLGSWLQRAGYHTGFIGKYMNEYDTAPDTDEGFRPGPGYDRWWSFVGKPGYYDYTISDDGEREDFAEAPEDHSTSQITELSKDFLTSATGDQPFFLWTSYYSPHVRSGGPDPYCSSRSPIPEPEDEQSWLKATLPKSPAYDESDNSDKPPLFRGLPPLSKGARAKILRRYRCTLQSMAGVDRGIAALDKTLKASGERRRTIVIYLSDNGYFFGEHRITYGKVWPYDPSARVPWAMRVPDQFLGGRHAPKEIRDPVGTIDLAPTILDLAMASPCVVDDGGARCRIFDGRSIVPLLRGEKWDQDRDILLQIGQDCNGYSAVRSPEYLYGEYYAPAREANHGKARIGNDGTPDCRMTEAELYRINEDPNQLHNLLREPPVSKSEIELAARLHDRLTDLRLCSGVGSDGSEGQPSCR